MGKSVKPMSKEDKAKLEELCIFYERKLLDIAMYYLRNKYDAEDAVQSTYLKLCTNMHKIDDIYSARTAAFLRTIVRNYSFNIIKMRKRFVPFDEESFDLPPSESLEDTFFKEDSIRILYDVLAKMDEDNREILTMRYMDELSIQEIADILDINYHAAAKRLERAEKLLSEICIKEGIDYEIW